MIIITIVIVLAIGKLIIVLARQIETEDEFLDSDEE
jgi:multisubunit Na+/H+ antiporter MnhC subunit